MTTKQYKDLTGNTFDSVQLNSFSGYEIKKEFSKISYITEYLDGEVLGTISFRPTKLPVIFSVKYGNYREERYNHGGISSRYVVNKDSKLSGEYTRYTSAGVLTEVRYFNDSTEVSKFIIHELFCGTTEIYKIHYVCGDFSTIIEVSDFSKYTSTCIASILTR